MADDNTGWRSGLFGALAMGLQFLVPSAEAAEPAKGGHDKVICGSPFRRMTPEDCDAYKKSQRTPAPPSKPAVPPAEKPKDGKHELLVPPGLG